MCDIDSCESPEFFVEKMRKARKEHICDECGSVIDKGEFYQHVSAKWDGVVQTVKTCEFCKDVRIMAENFYYEDGICVPYCSLWDCVDMDFAATNGGSKCESK